MVDHHTEFGGAAKDPSASHSPNALYLMKAEPDSRIVKGKDVKFSVDDFETAQTTAWEGVRNYEARNLMQGMNIGDKVLFYHSNTKNPGIAAFAEVSREAYPDHTAWDETHPYYDAKSDASSPRWYMVDVRFTERVSHFVPLSLLRYLSSLSKVPEEMAYLSPDDLKAIKGMALLNKGRLSVQKVEKRAWDAVSKIAEEGDGGIVIKGAIKSGEKSKGEGQGMARDLSKKRGVKEDKEKGEEKERGVDDVRKDGQKRGKEDSEGPTRRSKRLKK